MIKRSRVLPTEIEALRADHNSISSHTSTGISFATVRRSRQSPTQTHYIRRLRPIVREGKVIQVERVGA